MRPGIGIRREDKNRWERRTPLTPGHVRHLIEKEGIDVQIQPSAIRAFSDEEYIQAGASVQEDLSTCSVIFAIKEIPIHLIEEEATYIFFSHTIKGQPHNMPMLRKMREKKCQIIDYEKILDDRGFRLIFFGRFAGLAGMIDTLWALGRRLEWEGIHSPFSLISPAHTYGKQDNVRAAFASIADAIKQKGIPAVLAPMVCGFAGYGKVSKGAREIIDLLPIEEIQPAELAGLYAQGSPSRNCFYTVVFKEEDIVQPVPPKELFNLQEYYHYPERYEGCFSRYLPFLTVLVNCIYWDPKYPRLVTIKDLQELFTPGATPRLRIIGDISCDLNGSIEATVKTTTPDNPVYVYDPSTGLTSNGPEGSGPVILAVDNLPCELSYEASLEFSKVLLPWVIDIARADYSGSFENCNLPETLKQAMILYHGEFTEPYKYMKDFL